MADKGTGKASDASSAGSSGAKDAPSTPPPALSDELMDLQMIARDAAALAQNEKVFLQAFDAYNASDASRFQAALDQVGLTDECERVCYFFCEKECVARCLLFCREPAPVAFEPGELMAFAQAFAKVASDPAAPTTLADIVDRGDVDAWNAYVKQIGMDKYCHQLCHFFCEYRCRRKCRELCPPKPLITRVGSIPIAQINSLGYGNGPSIPPFHVGPPNPPAGYGDHPFGGSVWLMGVFNMPSATQYRVEFSSTGPGGPYNPLLVTSVDGYNWISVFPFEVPCSRAPSGGGDPGWFNIADICDSDGGPTTTGEKTLLYWPTGSLPDGVYYLRLQVRDGIVTRVSSPQVCRLDNTGPFPLPRPTISLQLKKADGTLEPLTCGKVKKGDGLIAVTVWAYDPNLSGVSVTAHGDSGLSVPVVDITSTPLSKTYNGVLAETGYPVPTTFIWDPWSDPRMVPCCYLVYVEINDRTIINDSYSGGHYNSGWEAIEIGL